MFSVYLLCSMVSLLFIPLILSEIPSEKLAVLSAGSNPSLNDLKAWIKFHKESGKVDSILGKCYECIRDRNSKEDDSSLTNPALNSYIEPKYSDTEYGSVAFYLNGPIIRTGGQFISSNGYDISSGSRQSKTKTSTCIVGKLGIDAYATACEYGNSYCKTINGYGMCASICAPILNTNLDYEYETICTTGSALSNKLNPICLDGLLSQGSSGARPVMCNFNQQCKIDFSINGGTSGCADTCEYTATTDCSTSDYPFKGSNDQYSSAILLACGNKDVCMTVTDPSSGISVGSCSSAGNCVNSTYVKCTTIDYANKIGVLCYIGVFGVDAFPSLCSNTQYCQRESILTPYGSTLSVGKCQSNCITSYTSYCCKSDLCNAYETTLNHRRCEKKNAY